MKKAYLLLLATILSTASIAGAQQAQAQGFQVKKNQLDKVEHYHHPIEVQILDERPMVKDFRTADVQQQYVINVGPGPQAVQNTQVINVPGAPQGSAGSVSVPRLQPAGFGSQIPAGGTFKPNGLPSGASTNRLMGTYKPPAQTKPASNKITSKPSQARQSAAPQTALIVPRPTASGSSTSGGMKTSADVYGTVQKRGSLLGR